jgi:hypothetical protein
MAKSAKEHRHGHSLIKMRLRYEMADANVIDRYLFTLTISDGLKVHYDNGAGRHKDLNFTVAALESAKSHIVLSQGNAVSSGSPPDTLPDHIISELPPFLLSRAVFAALKTKGKANFKFEWSDEIGEVAVKGKTNISILIEGKNVLAPVLHCVGNLHECQLWVIEDDSWPIIIKHDEEDDYFWKLIEAGSGLEPDE